MSTPMDATTDRVTSAGPAPLLSVRDLSKRFPVKSKGALRRITGYVHAVDRVGFDIYPGETLALVGESGSGKSTTGRCVLRLTDPDTGDVRFDGKDVMAMSRRQLRSLRREMQIVFQDPHSALDPRMTVGGLVAEPLIVHGESRAVAQRRARELFDLVGLSSEHTNRYPHEFSGGQLQRVGIARALSLNPRLLVLDEPVSALDVSIQAGVLNLLADLQRELGLSYLLIAHDLAVVQDVADRIAVMNLGRVVETGPTSTIYDAPAHPYTQALLSAVPLPDPIAERRRQRVPLTGEPPDPASPPSGCVFRLRCWKAAGICAAEEPPLRPHTPARDGMAACHFPGPNSS